MPSKPIKTTFTMSKKLSSDELQQVLCVYAEAHKIKNNNLDSHPEDLKKSILKHEDLGTSRVILAYNTENPTKEKVLIGFTFSHMDGDEDLILDHICTITPPKVKEKKGLGMKLMSVLFKEAADEHISYVSVVASHDTQLFYEKCLFTKDNVADTKIKLVHLHNDDVMGTAKRLSYVCKKEGYNQNLKCAA